MEPPLSEDSKRGWREGVGDEQGSKHSENLSPELCSPSPKIGIGRRAQKRDLNLWHRKDLLAPTPSARQPLFETSDFIMNAPTEVQRSLFR